MSNLENFIVIAYSFEYPVDENGNQINGASLVGDIAVELETGKVWSLEPETSVIRCCLSTDVVEFLVWWHNDHLSELDPERPIKPNHNGLNRSELSHWIKQAELRAECAESKKFTEYIHTGRMIEYRVGQVSVVFRYVYSNGNRSKWQDCGEFSNGAELLEAHPDIQKI